MRAEQLNIFGQKRIDFNEQVDLTITSLTEYGDRHEHWAIAWSWGKDSTTLVTLTVQLILTGQVRRPKSLTVLCADTRMELIPLWQAALGIIDKLRCLGIDVKVVTAPIDDRFLVYILGRGVPPPSNTFRWCTPQIKVEPMEAALVDLYNEINVGMSEPVKILMLTGVRQGESAIRDGRIAMSCSKDGAECGQGWYQTGLQNDMCATLAPLLHWRVCSVWDWLKVVAPSKNYGEWPTAILADAYGGDEAEEINARTGCIACPLVETDKALTYLIRIPYWAYLKPLLKLKAIYREMRLPKYRKRKNGDSFKKDGSLESNPQRLGPLTMEARLDFLEQILNLQAEVNSAAVAEGKPQIDILNTAEVARIRELIAKNTWPKKWTGKEITGAELVDTKYADGSVMPLIFKQEDFE